jgi:hypothetical protein
MQNQAKKQWNTPTLEVLDRGFIILMQFNQIQQK